MTGEGKNILAPGAGYPSYTTERVR